MDSSDQGLLRHAVELALEAERRGGAVSLVEHLPPYVAARAQAMSWLGPVWPEVCDPLCRRALARYWSTSF
jgi:hypothetical protein